MIYIIFILSSIGWSRMANFYNISYEMSCLSQSKRKNASDMMVQIMNINLPDELLRCISTYVFYDISSNAYQEKQYMHYYKSAMRYIVHEFKECRVSLPLCGSIFVNVQYKINGYTIMGWEKDQIIYQRIILSLCQRCGNYRSDAHYRISCQCEL